MYEISRKSSVVIPGVAMSPLALKQRRARKQRVPLSLKLDCVAPHHSLPFSSTKRGPRHRQPAQPLPCPRVERHRAPGRADRLAARPTSLHRRGGGTSGVDVNVAAFRMRHVTLRRRMERHRRRCLVPTQAAPPQRMPR